MFKEVFVDHVTLKSIFAAIGSCSAWLLGGINAALLALTVLYVTDFVLGFYRAWNAGTYSSSRFRRGLGKFLLYVLVIMSAHMLDLSLADPLPFVSSYVRDFMVAFICINEFLSVCRHLGELGMRVPRKLIVKLESFQEQEGEK
ncbi:phage holin family protein [Oceanidesulfovibrio marinus]|uniref:Phage holin family protein n=1 Tax=Oceanidesulfovibrio marinus TaxID=370038 RepID=A0ABX6NI40_9BACT|nr:phage holin family protein [Oceanidesulfovibrio marinus]QJT10237.1 phage holin family protein [Oceanidesulfovibrio marinus]